MPRQQNRAARRMRRPGLFGKRSAGAIWAGAACWLLFSCGTQSADGCQAYLGSWVQGLPRCQMTEQDYVNGHWEKLSAECAPTTLQEVGEYAYPYETYCNPMHHVCTNETDTCSRKAVNITSWQWVPDTCNLHHFSAEELDRKFAGRRVMMVGDSIQVQQFFSLRHMLRKVIAGPQPPEWGFFHTRGGAQFQLHAAQFLVGEPCCNHFVGQSLEVQPAAEWLEYSRDADVLVLNTGHHWHRRDVSFTSYAHMVRNVMQTLQHHFKGYIIFRTSSWGHHRCSTIKEPLHSAREALDFGSLDNDPYHWMKPIFREHLWGDLAAELGLSHRFRFINTSMTMLRGDAHLDRQQDANSNNVFDDCLHYCMPGPVDLWNWALYNTLISLPLDDRNDTSPSDH